MPNAGLSSTGNSHSMANEEAQRSHRASRRQQQAQHTRASSPGNEGSQWQVRSAMSNRKRRRSANEGLESQPSEPPYGRMKLTTTSIRALLGNDSDDGHREVAPTVWQEDFSRIHNDVKSAVTPRDIVEQEGSTDKTHQRTHTRMDGARPITNASREINFTMLQEHFHKPLRDAAQHFGICTTLLKKICRKNGITSWPYRQIIGLEKSISSMEQQVQYFDGEQRRQYAEQLNKLQRRLVSFERTGQSPRDDEMNASVVLQSLPSMSNATRTEKSSSKRQESIAAVIPEPVSTNGFRTKPEPSTPSPVGSASVRPLPSIAFILNGETHSEDSQ